MSVPLSMPTHSTASTWPRTDNCLSLPPAQITYRKTIYFDLCKRIQQQCLATAAASPPFSQQEALDAAICGFITFMGQQGTIKPYSLTQMANRCPRLQKPHLYEGRVLKWPRSPKKSKPGKAQAQATAGTAP